MKVWEKCAELKAPNATESDIYKWMYMNRVCPLVIGDELELDDEKEIQKQKYKMQQIAETHCQNSSCSPDCYRSFINLEFE